MEVTCSQWAYSKWEQAIESGDTQAADNYMQLYNLWHDRETK